jgi:type I restriction enzyme R subunit
VQAGQSEDTPASLDTKGKRALYNNLGHNEALALAIDTAVREARPDDWRDNGGPRENIVKAALLRVLIDTDEVERIFPVIKAQSEY